MLLSLILIIDPLTLSLFISEKNRLFEVMLLCIKTVALTSSFYSVPGLGRRRRHNHRLNVGRSPHRYSKNSHVIGVNDGQNERRRGPNGR